MARNKGLKKLIRQRMERTGESYTAARAQLLKQGARSTAEKQPLAGPTPPPAVSPPIDAVAMEILRRYREEHSIDVEQVMDWAEAVLPAALERRAIASPLWELALENIRVEASADELTMTPDNGAPTGYSLIQRALRIAERFGGRDAEQSNTWSDASLRDPTGSARKAIVKFLRLAGVRVHVHVWKEASPRFFDDLAPSMLN